MCPQDLEQIFLSSYRAERKFYVASKHFKTLQNKQNKQRNELKSVKAQLKAKESALISPQGNLTQKAALFLEIKELNQQSGKLETLITQTDKEVSLAKAKLNHIANTARR